MKLIIAAIASACLSTAAFAADFGVTPAVKAMIEANKVKQEARNAPSWTGKAFGVDAETAKAIADNKAAREASRAPSYSGKSLGNRD